MEENKAKAANGELLAIDEREKDVSLSETIPLEEKPARGGFISISEAEERYPLGRDWYYKHMKKGTLPFPWYPLSIGKRYVKISDIEAWLNQREVPAGTVSGNIKGGQPMR